MSILIEFLKQYELNDIIISKYNNVLTKPNIKKLTVSKKFNINKKNLFFYLYYICKYNTFEYNHEMENKEKFACIELVRNNADILKGHKISKINFEEDLLYSKNINLGTLKILCAYNNISIVLLYNKCYYHFDYGTNITCYDTLQKSVEFDIDSDKLNVIKKNYYYLDKTDKPLYNISYYKVEDLRGIASKLDISYTNFKLKKDLYEAIRKKLTQMI